MSEDIKAAAAYVLHMQEQREYQRHINEINPLFGLVFNNPGEKPIIPFEALPEHTKQYWRNVVSGMSHDEAHTILEKAQRQRAG